MNERLVPYFPRDRWMVVTFGFAAIYALACLAARTAAGPNYIAFLAPLLAVAAFLLIVAKWPGLLGGQRIAAREAVRRRGLEHAPPSWPAGVFIGGLWATTMVLYFSIEYPRESALQYLPVIVQGAAGGMVVGVVSGWGIHRDAQRLEARAADVRLPVVSFWYLTRWATLIGAVFLVPIVALPPWYDDPSTVVVNYAVGVLALGALGGALLWVIDYWRVHR